MPQGSRPQYRVLVEKDVPMHSRDGVTLRTDVYRPDTAGRFPVLLSRLPYNKNLRPRPGDIDYFVERGYGVIMQDTSWGPGPTCCLAPLPHRVVPGISTSVSAPDTDFTAKLVDVRPDG